MTVGIKQYIIIYMKTTIDIPDDLYRSVKSRSALEGMTVRSATLMLYGDWLARPRGTPGGIPAMHDAKSKKPLPPWFGIGRANVRKNSGRAAGIEEMREAIAAGIAAERQPAKGGRA